MSLTRTGAGASGGCRKPCNRTVFLDPSYAHIYAASGKKEESRGIPAELERVGSWEIMSAYYVASCYYVLGDKEEGFEFLERAFSGHDGYVLQMGIDREISAVRDDSRCSSLIERLVLKRSISVGE